ncbi:MADS-box transcription factor 47-like [Dorcoceras hygrometricum]|uniref:MADS-box transcription factor 47-like n=1 Tax=Dorcoceras hygrometricum TaxID=472368 RepID=A0A2Z7BBN6_9LAMI|nr:MADS-box transcription factor 47-like [Dorcoceras hygrometricum]
MDAEENQIVAVTENKKRRKDRRVGIRLIEDRGELNTTFTKRRQGLFKKTMDLCEKFDAEAAVIAFSRSGNLYVLGDPEFYPLLKRYLADPSSSLAAEGQLPPHQKPALTDMESRIDEALGKGRAAWDLITENLGLNQLEEMEKAVEVMITKLAAA